MDFVIRWRPVIRHGSQMLHRRRWMDTRVFSYVQAVADCKSISAAARRLFMSQPALTKQLGKLEAELGSQLFDRSHTPLTVTDEGELFLEFVSRYQELERELREGLGKSRTPQAIPVRVATTHRGGHYAGVHTAGFLKNHPEVVLEYLDMSAEKCEEALEDEVVDLAIYTDPVMSDRLEYMPLEEDPLVFVVPRENGILAGVDTEGSSLEHPVEIEVEKFRSPSLRYVLSTPEHSLYYAECAFLKKFRIQPASLLRVDYVDTRYAIACGGGGIVLIPHTTVMKAEKNEDVVYCTVKGENLYRYVVVARKKGKHMTPEAQQFWRFMVKQKG